MAYSFTDKLYHVYFNLSKNRGKSRFRAYCILLKSIRFNPNEDFIDNITSSFSKQRQIYRNLLLGRPIRDNESTKYSLKYSDIDFILEALLYLKTRLSKSLMYSLCDNINDIEVEKYLKGLFFSYFNLVKSGDLNEFNQQTIPTKMKYLKNNIPNRKDKRTINYGPRMTTNSEVWGSALPFYIKSIPMGGRNKKY